MKPIKLEKISEEDNVLGWEIIEIISREICSLTHGKEVTHYNYRFLAICDGFLNWIEDVDFLSSMDAYKVVE